MILTALIISSFLWTTGQQPITRFFDLESVEDSEKIPSSFPRVEDLLLNVEFCLSSPQMINVHYNIYMNCNIFPVFFMLYFRFCFLQFPPVNRRNYNALTCISQLRWGSSVLNTGLAVFLKLWGFNNLNLKFYNSPRKKCWKDGWMNGCVNTWNLRNACWVFFSSVFFFWIDIGR